VNNRELELVMLFDFFGELLTAKQKEYFDLYHNQDLSLSEIAENDGISRQGVRDIIVRAENILTDTEKKTGIVSRYLQNQAEIAEIEKQLNEILNLNQTNFKNVRLQELAGTALNKLQLLKG